MVSYSHVIYCVPVLLVNIENITPLIVKKNKLMYLAVLTKNQLTKEFPFSAALASYI